MFFFLQQLWTKIKSDVSYHLKFQHRKNGRKVSSKPIKATRSLRPNYFLVCIYLYLLQVHRQKNVWWKRSKQHVDLFEVAFTSLVIWIFDIHFLLFRAFACIHYCSEWSMILSFIMWNLLTHKYTSTTYVAQTYNVCSGILFSVLVRFCCPTISIVSFALSVLLYSSLKNV